MYDTCESNLENKIGNNKEARYKNELEQSSVGKVLDEGTGSN